MTVRRLLLECVVKTALMSARDRNELCISVFRVSRAVRDDKQLKHAGYDSGDDLLSHY